MTSFAMDLADSIMTRILAITPRMRELITSYNEDDNPPLFALRDEAIELLRSQRLLRRIRINSKSVGVHPRNRYGDGIVPSHVLQLIEDFVSGGFSLVEVGVPLASEMPPKGHARYEPFMEFNNKVTRESLGALPPYDEEEIKIVSVTKSHTSQGNRCIACAAPHENPKCTSEDGKLSIHKIRQLRPGYADVVETGFEWDVVVWAAEDAFDGIMDLLQEAGNAGQQIAQAETRMELCLKIHGSAKRYKNIVKEEDLWKKVERDALRGKPAFRNEVPDLCVYVKHMSGSIESPHLLLDIVSFGRTLKTPRVITGSILAGLATAVLGEDGVGCMLFRMDSIRAMLAAGDKYASNGVQALLNAVDIRKMQDPKKLHPFVVIADKMKSQGIAIAAKVAAPDAAVKGALCLFGIRLVHQVFQKPDEARGVFKSLHDIGHMFIQDLSNIAGVPITSPWSATAAPKPDAADAPKMSSSSISEVFETGCVDRAAQLNTRGFRVDAWINHPKTKMAFCIKEISDDKVVLERDNGDKIDVNTSSFLKSVVQGEYKRLAKAPTEADKDAQARSYLITMYHFIVYIYVVYIYMYIIIEYMHFFRHRPKRPVPSGSA